MLSSSTSFLSFSLRFIILQVLRFTMRDWLALPITDTTNNENNDREEEAITPSWFTILNVFSIAKKIKEKASHPNIQQEITTKKQVNKQQQEDNDEFDSEEKEESHLPRTFSSSSIATSTNTEHSSSSPTVAENNKITHIKIYWNHGGNKVQVTGEFDNWSASIDMVRDTENRHVVEIPMDLTNQKDIEYKFVVDGEWKYAVDLPHRNDWHGNINNVIYCNK